MKSEKMIKLRICVELSIAKNRAICYNKVEMKNSRVTLYPMLKEKMREALSSVLPVTAIVLILAITIVPLEPGPVVLFLFGALMLILGMSFFTLGVDMSMTPMGEGVGVQLAKSKNRVLPVILCFLLGVIVTIAEPDLTVLADQITGIDSLVIILAVALGVGLFLALSLLRAFFKIPFSYILIFFYTIVFVIAIFFVPKSFIPASFDSGGVTTGPITVPFLMALGVGLASSKTSKNSQSDSFGTVAMCSIGPILAVLILGIIKQPTKMEIASSAPVNVSTTRAAMAYFIKAFPHYFKEVALSLSPIAVVFLLFQLFTKRFHRHQLIRVISGFIYTYLGLVLFLTGVNIGFMPVGSLIGGQLASSQLKWLLIPVGMVVGYFIVAAEPAVHVLKKQVEDVSSGAISAKSMGIALSIGVSVSVGIAMLRILTGISILWFLIPGYIFALLLTFFVPQMFTGVAFDAGGVASGPMTATFLLPLATGACSALGGNLLEDAFGIVAMVAMTPLVTIQLLGFISAIKKKIAKRNLTLTLNDAEDTILYFDGVDENGK